MGNEMTAELLAKFNALQLQADNEANKKVKNRNGKVDADNKKEIKIFQDLVSKQYSEGKINDADYATLMGVTFTTQAAATTEAVAKEEVAPQEKTKKEKRAEKKALEAKQDNIKNDIEALIEGNKKARLAKDPSISLDNLVEKITAKNSGEYSEVIADVQKVVDFVKGTKFDSKKQVEALEKQIKDNKDFNDFQKDLAESMVELAKREQVNKEAKELVDKYYNPIRNNDKNAQNFSNYLRLVEEEIDKTGKKDTSYYSDEALDALKEIINQDIDNIADQKRLQMIKDKSNNVTEKKVKKALVNDTPETDKLFNKRVKKQKDENKLTARWLDRERTAEDLEKISEKDLKKELGDELYNVLGKYLETKKNPDGSYNVRDLSDKLFERVGYDVWVNMSDDTEMSELKGIKNELKILTGRDLSEKDIKKILKLVHIPIEPKNRNFMRALKESIIPGIAGAVAGASTSSKLHVTQRVQLNMDASTATDMISQLQAAGITPSVTAGVDGKIVITILQEVLQDHRALMALAGAGIGVLTGTLMNLIFGMENNEKSCISIADFDLTDEKYTNIDNYKAYVKEMHPEAKANLIVALADTFHAKYGDDWAKHFDSTLKKFAGKGSVLNCLELKGGALMSVEPVDNCNVNVTDLSTPEKEEIIDMTKIHNRQAGDTWKGLVEAYYPDLVTKCNGELYGKNGAIRALKKALSVNEDGSFNADFYKKLLVTGNIPELIKLPLDINGAKRVNGKVKPDEEIIPGGKSLIDKVGKDEIKVNKIQGTQLWKAIDGCDENIHPVYAETPKKAVMLLEELTKKKYSNRDEYINK